MPAHDSTRLVLSHGPLRFSTEVAGLDQGEEQACVVCLHGFPDNARSFRHQLPALAAAGYRVYAPMMRGYEPSSQPAGGDYSIDALASDVIAWLDELGEAQVDLVGHDWGAAVAYRVGALAPERFRSLTTIAVPHAARFFASVPRVPIQVRHSWYMLFFQLRGIAEHVVERDDWALIRRLWADWSPSYRLSDEEWADLRETFAAPGVKHAMLGYYRHALAPRAIRDLQTQSPLVPVRTMAITGVDDGCIDTRLFDHALDEADFPAGLRVERIVNAGHFAHLERPKRINALLLDWLAS